MEMLRLADYLGEFGAAIAAAGVLAIGWMSNRTTNNLNQKIANQQSLLLKTGHDIDRMERQIEELKYHIVDIRRNHP